MLTGGYSYGFCELYITTVDLKQSNHTKHQRRFLRLRVFIRERRMPASLVAQWRSLPVSVGDLGSIPDLGRSHMPWSNKVLAPQLLRLWAAATEDSVPRACALPQETRRAQRETHIRQLEGSPVCVCVCARECVWMCACTHVCMYVHVCTCVYV